ncbi:hypothetical protein J0A68_19255 [Algoriphagus sp. H41]|uniref:Uncharacterized protein n=1 Tax=Algoriphagus oliviformis TaxID=2811231 RepID=A0ABS3C969_9BACT|nr:hypothetical protein [Algoriphagus oliviformis]MBN7813101.1 hypothetical protein [Algoriphagus oliviformis]
MSLGGGVIALLLSVIAYFLKLLMQDFRLMGTELARLKESVVRLEAEQALIKSLLEKYRMQFKNMRF